MNNNTQHDQHKPGRSLVGCVIFLIIALPVLYLLSIGPILWLFIHMTWSMDTYYAICFPLVWLHENSFLKEPIEWYFSSYVSWFIPVI